MNSNKRCPLISLINTITEPSLSIIKLLKVVHILSVSNRKDNSYVSVGVATLSKSIPTSRSDSIISRQFIVLNELQSDPIVLTILGLNSKLCFRDCSQVLMPGKIFKLRPSLTDSGTWKSVGQKNLRDEYLNRTANFVLFYDFKMKCRLVLNLCWYWSVSKVLLVLMMLTSVDVEAF